MGISCVDSEEGLINDDVDNEDRQIPDSSDMIIEENDINKMDEENDILTQILNNDSDINITLEEENNNNNNHSLPSKTTRTDNSNSNNNFEKANNNNNNNDTVNNNNNHDDSTTYHINEANNNHTDNNNNNSNNNFKEANNNNNNDTINNNHDDSTTHHINEATNNHTDNNDTTNTLVDNDIEDSDTILEGELEEDMCIPKCDIILHCSDSKYARKGQLLFGSKCITCRKSINSQYLRKETAWYCKYFGYDNDDDGNDVKSCNYIECDICRSGKFNGKRRRLRSLAI